MKKSVPVLLKMKDDNDIRNLLFFYILGPDSVFLNSFAIDIDEIFPMGKWKRMGPLRTKMEFR